MAYRTGDQTSQSIMVVPIEGGTPRALLTVARPPGGLAHRVVWLPDSRRLIVGRSEGGKPSLVLVPLDGGTPVTLALSPDVVGPFLRVHPDGRRVIYSEGDPAFEVWTLENFLPVASRK